SGLDAPTHSFPRHARLLLRDNPRRLLAGDVHRIHHLSLVEPPPHRQRNSRLVAGLGRRLIASAHLRSAAPNVTVAARASWNRALQRIARISHSEIGRPLF